jgi:hypothetical protein
MQRRYEVLRGRMRRHVKEQQRRDVARRVGL